MKRACLAALAAVLSLTLTGCVDLLHPVLPSPSEGDVVSQTALSDTDLTEPEKETIVIPEVHIEGITLPEQYGMGVFDCEAVQWLVNEYRAQNGLQPLVWGESRLFEAAQIRMEEILGGDPVSGTEFLSSTFSHTRPDGRRYFTALTDLGVAYDCSGENLAYGQYTAEHVVKEWIESPTHNANLLEPRYTQLAVVCGHDDNDLTYWVYEAMRPAPEPETTENNN